MNIKKFRKNYLLLFLAFFIFLIFPKSALAAWWNPFSWFKGTVTEAILFLPVVFLNFIGWVSKGLALLSAGLLEYVITGKLIGWGYTNNTVVKLGLGITQQFVNLGLVVVLVVVALLITLNYKANDAKKIFAKLIIIALLVNFAPVLVGLIVDATNITMNYFLSATQGQVSGILDGITGSTASILQNLWNVKNLADGFGILAQICAIILLNIGLAFAFFILTAVFMTRYIIIWLLTILSPLAFVAWILPQTKKFWETWWHQLIQWSIIGIPMAFFLYLSMASYQGLVAVKADISMPELGSVVDWFNTTFPYILVLVMMYLGLIMGLKTSAMGAETFTGWSQAVGARLRQVPNTIGKKIWNKGIRPSIEAPARGAAEWMGRAASRVGNWDIGFGKIPLLKKIKPLAPVKWFYPEKLRQLGEMRPSIEKAMSELKMYSSGNQAQRFLTGTDKGVYAVGDLLNILEKGDSQDIFKEARKIGKWKGMTDQEILKDKDFIKITSDVMKNANQAGMLGSELLRKSPRLAKVAAEAGILKGPNGKPLAPAEAVTKIANEARSQHIKFWEQEELQDPDVAEAVLSGYGREKLLNIGQLVKNGRETITKQIDEEYAKFIANNPELRGFNPLQIVQDYELGNANSTRNKEYWEKFREEWKRNHNGSDTYFKAIEDERLRKDGWRPGQVTVELINKYRYGETGDKASPGGSTGKKNIFNAMKNKSASKTNIYNAIFEKEKKKP